MHICNYVCVLEVAILNCLLKIWSMCVIASFISIMIVLNTLIIYKNHIKEEKKVLMGQPTLTWSFWILFKGFLVTWTHYDQLLYPPDHSILSPLVCVIHLQKWNSVVVLYILTLLCKMSAAQQNCPCEGCGCCRCKSWYCFWGGSESWST